MRAMAYSSDEEGFFSSDEENEGMLHKFNSHMK